MAAGKKPKSTTGRKRAPAKRMPKKAAAGSRGIGPQDCRLDADAGDVAEISRRIEQEGGVVLGTYREPLGGNPVVFASLPIDKVEPTPFQRDLSEAHHKEHEVRAEKFNTEKIKQEDLAGAGGVPDEEP